MTEILTTYAAIAAGFAIGSLNGLPLRGGKDRLMVVALSLVWPLVLLTTVRDVVRG